MRNLVEFGIVRVMSLLIGTVTRPDQAVLGLAMSIFSLWLLKQGSPSERRLMIVVSVLIMIWRLM